MIMSLRYLNSLQILIQRYHNSCLSETPVEGPWCIEGGDQLCRSRRVTLYTPSRSCSPDQRVRDPARPTQGARFNTIIPHTQVPNTTPPTKKDGRRGRSVSPLDDHHSVNSLAQTSYGARNCFHDFNIVVNAPHSLARSGLLGCTAALGLKSQQLTTKTNSDSYLANRLAERSHRRAHIE